MRMLMLAMLITGCDEAFSPMDGAGPSVAQPPTASSGPITAEYRPSHFGQRVLVRVSNPTDAPICFQHDDLVPGFGSTFVGNIDGSILNASLNPILNLYKGVNLAGPVAVVPPKGNFEAFIELEEYEDAGPARVQVTVVSFKCRDLFDPTVNEPERVVFSAAFELRAQAAIPAAPFVDLGPPPSEG